MTDLGLYVHIPFCRHICSYCDFAKTARYDGTLVQAYFAHLARDLRCWLGLLFPQHYTQIATLNLGGGTPSLFCDEYAPLMELVAPYLAPGAEISLEANPLDITHERLQSWRALGFNRLSIGVQSFAKAGLASLKRDHDARAAQRAVELSLSQLPHTNIDLIYSWPGQDLATWRRDLTQALSLGVPHLSLYNLTYAAGTPLGRAHARGKINEPADEAQAEFYEEACALLADADYEHDEVSNWAKPSFTCQHNWRYWQGQSYLGLGAGAHSYLRAFGGDIGLRFAQEKQLKAYLQQGEGFAGVLIEERDHEAWLMEYVGSALRCRKGLDLQLIRQVTGREFKPQGWLAEAVVGGNLQIHDGRLLLKPREWFRETAWSVAVLEGFGS